MIISFITLAILINLSPISCQKGFIRNYIVKSLLDTLSTHVSDECPGVCVPNIATLICSRVLNHVECPDATMKCCLQDTLQNAFPMLHKFKKALLRNTKNRYTSTTENYNEDDDDDDDDDGHNDDDEKPDGDDYYYHEVHENDHNNETTTVLEKPVTLKPIFNETTAHESNSKNLTSEAPESPNSTGHMQIIKLDTTSSTTLKPIPLTTSMHMTMTRLDDEEEPNEPVFAVDNEQDFDTTISWDLTSEPSITMTPGGSVGDQRTDKVLPKDCPGVCVQAKMARFCDKILPVEHLCTPQNRCCVSNDMYNDFQKLAHLE